MPASTLELLDRVFRDPSAKFGLRYFTKGERNRIKLRENEESKVEIWCVKREKWLRAKPEEVVRQMVLVWVLETLRYPLNRVLVEWPIQMGEDEEKQRADIAVFTDDACTNPYLVFELKKPDSKEGLEQLRSYLRWTGCFFGCWSNGSDHSFQLKEEDKETKKGPYKFRDIPRLPKLDEDLEDILAPLTFAELKPIQDMRALIERLEHDALANAGGNAFDELFKLFFAKLHDEFRPKRKDKDPVDFRVPTGAPDVIYKWFNDLFLAAKKRPHWNQIFDDGDVLKLKGDALRLCAAALEQYSLTHTDLDAVDAAFEYLINPEQKGQKGQYFTPRPVVKMAVKMLNPQDGERVIDPACGSCGFLIHTIRHVQHLYGWSTNELYRYANEYLYAVDFDERLKKVAKTMMIIAGDGKANVFGISSLDLRDWQNSDARTRIGEFSKDVRDGNLDLVLTNPPFAGKITGKTQLAAYDLYELAATGALAADDEEDEADEAGDEAEKLKKRKKVSGMKRDILFIERALDLLKPGGRCALVLPQGNLNNLGTRALREYIANRARLLAVVGLHVNSFKPFTGTKTSVVFLQKWGGDAGGDIDGAYLVAFFNTLPGSALCRRAIYGSGQPHIGPKYLERIRVPRIGKLEAKAAQLIREAHNQIETTKNSYPEVESELLERLGWEELEKQSRELCFSTNFLNLSTAARNDAERFHPHIARVQHFLTKQKAEDIATVCDFVKHGVQPPYLDNGKVGIVSQRQFTGSGLDLDSLENFTNDQFCQENPDFRIRKCDVLTYCVSAGEYLGRTYLFGSDRPCVAASFVTILRTTKLVPGYLALFLNSPFGVAQSNAFKRGTSPFYLYPRDLKNVLVYVPRNKSGEIDLAWQEKLAAKVEASTRAREQAKAKLAEAKRLVEAALAAQ